MRIFRDRVDAGERLARALERFRGEDVLVLGLPRGGVPVAAEVARALGAELDVIVARKLGAPGAEEYGVGAIAPGASVLDLQSLRALGLEPEDMADTEARERAELERRERAYRGSRPPPRVEGRTVILVDDGVATGVTARAALKSLRAQQPRRLVFAAPVGPEDAPERLAAFADEVVLLETPLSFRAVGLWYADFSATSDEEVLEALARGGSTAMEVRIPVPEGGHVSGTLTLPPHALGLVVFAHGSGSSRFSPRNQFVARVLQQRGLGTLLMDLLTPDEERIDDVTRELRFDIPLLARRLARAAEWASQEPATAALPVGYFGSSTGGGAALVAAAESPERVRAVVSRGGRPDLAGDALPLVQAPTLLLVGGRDEVVLDMNAGAKARMRCEAKLRVVPGATHLFEEPGALEEVAGAAADWFAQHLPATIPRDTERALRK